jgi:GT2 family glycosyltransferase
MVVVCHHSSGVVGDCIASFRRASRAAGVDSHVVLVEQSEDAVEQRAVDAVTADVMVVRPNRGYAAGLNAGIESADGDVLLLANPDLVFTRDSVAGLISGLDAGFDVVGPQLVWDRSGSVLFPPAENPAPTAELARTLRRRWRPWWRLGLSRWIEGLWRVWSAAGPAEVASLRGPLLVLRRAAADRLGPLDEGYFLYYEETEWLLRARRMGQRFAVVGPSRVVHAWGHATSRLGDRARVEETARERFFDRNYPRVWRSVLRSAAGRHAPHTGVRGRVVAGPAEVGEIDADLWLFSTFRHLQPSVGAVRCARPPEEITELARTGGWYAVAAARVGGRWAVRGSWTWGHRERG